MYQKKCKTCGKSLQKFDTLSSMGKNCTSNGQKFGQNGQIFGRYLYSFGSRSFMYQLFARAYFWPLLVHFLIAELSASNFLGVDIISY